MRWTAALSVATVVTLCLPSAARAQQVQPPNETPADHVVEPEQAPSVAAVLREVPSDLWRFVSLDTAIVLSAGGAAATVARVWDDDLVGELQVNRDLNSAFRHGSKYGAFVIMLGGSFAVYGVGKVSGEGHLAVTGADLARSQIVAQLWVQAVKHTVQRERPDGSNYVSFPSGHSAAGFAAATVLTRHYGWKAAIPAYLGAAYIGAARVHDNRHYLSDVTFGAAMGIAAGRTVTLKAGRYGVLLAPAIKPGQIGLSATVVVNPRN